MERRRAGPSYRQSKGYNIANNNIQLYTINAIDKAVEIGLGKRTNTILQSPSSLWPVFSRREDAIKYIRAGG